MNDLLSGKTTETLLDYYHDLAELLLHKFRAKICFSLLIPTNNNEHLNAKVRNLNWEIVNLITYLRSKSRHISERIFTLDNSSISHHSSFTKGVDIRPRLNKRGSKMLWMRLEEGLKKTLRLPRTNSNSYVNNRYHE